MTALSAAQTSRRRGRILGIGFDLIDYRMVITEICRSHNRQTSKYICITNPHSVVMCLQDREMFQATESASLVLPDGVGIVLASSLLGYQHHGRVTGPDLMLRLCDEGRQYGLRHFLLGGASGVPERLAQRLVKDYPGLQIAGTLSPPFRKLSAAEDGELVARVNAAQADVLWVGLGAPKQEKWMASHVGRVQGCTMIGVGAAFDFHSGNSSRAPLWMRRWGLEWMHRFIQDPRRMWRRNVNQLIIFPILVLRQLALARFRA